MSWVYPHRLELWQSCRCEGDRTAPEIDNIQTIFAREMNVRDYPIRISLRYTAADADDTGHLSRIRLINNDLKKWVEKNRPSWPMTLWSRSLSRFCQASHSPTGTTSRTEM